MPPSTPRQDMTTAFGASPPSRISSHPTSLRPCAVRNSSIRCVNQLCNSSSFFKPSSRMRACASELACHWVRSEEHTSELQSRLHLVCRLLLEKKKKQHQYTSRR